MATFELKIYGELDELAGIANRIAGATKTGAVNMRGEPYPTELERAAADNGYVPSTAAAPGAILSPAPEAPKRTRAPKTQTKEDAARFTETADAAAPADTSASSTEASPSSGSATDVSPSPTPAAEQPNGPRGLEASDVAPKPEHITHPDQLLGSDVTPDMLKDAMSDALSKRLIPAAKVQGALKEATGGVASLTALWALPADADRAAKAQAAYAALIGLTA